MKNLLKKMVLVVSALAIAFGSLTMVSGCKKKESTPPPAKKEPAQPKQDNKLPE